MKKLIMFLVLGIFMISLASAEIFSFDNKLTYSDDLKEVNIKDLFGLGTNYADIKLTSHEDLDKPISIPRIYWDGYYPVLSFEIENYQDYNNIIKSFEFKNMDNSKTENKDYFIQKAIYKEVDIKDYKEVCELVNDKNGTSYNSCNQILFGTHKENQIINWVNITDTNFVKNQKETIRIMVYVKQGEHYDIIPEIYGKKITSWAEYETNPDEMDSMGISWASGVAAAYQDITTNGTDFWIAQWRQKINHFINDTHSGQNWTCGGGTKDSGVTTDGNNIWCTEFDSVFKVFKKDMSGGAIDDWASNKNALDPAGIATNGSIIYVLSFDFQNVDRNQMDGTYIDEVINPVVSAGTTTGIGAFGNYLYIAFPNNGSIEKYLWDGTHIKSFDVSGVLTPTALTIHPDGTIIYLYDGTNIHYFEGPTIEVADPTISIVYPTATVYTTDTLDFNYTFDEDTGTADSCWYSLDLGDTNSSRQDCGVNWTGLSASEGSNTWTVYGNITTGTMTNTTITFTVAPLVPDVTITFPIAAETYYTNLLNLNYITVTSGTLDSCWNSKDLGITNSSRVTYGTNFSLTGVDGSNTWTVYCNVTSGEMGNTTLDFTINTTPMIEFSGATPDNYTHQTFNTLFTNVTLTETYFENITFNLYNLSYGNIFSSFFDDGTRSINWSLPYDGNYTYNATVWTTTNQQNSTETRNLYLDSTAPSIIIYEPYSSQGGRSLPYNVTLNYTASDSGIGLESCWYNSTDNSTITITTCNELLNDNLTITTSGAHTIYVYANDTYGNEEYTSSTFFASILENSVSYNTSSFETEDENFKLNVTSYDTTITSITATLHYNGTESNGGSSSCNAVGECIIVNKIDIPIVGSTAPESFLKEFFWELKLYNGTGINRVNSTIRTQNVSKIHLEECGTYTIYGLNFTAQDSINETYIKPYSFKGTFDFWLGGGSITKSQSISNTTINETHICIYPNRTFYADGIIEYDESSGNTYVKKNYYLDNYPINWSITNIELLLLPSESSTTFIQEVLEDQKAVSNARIETYRYYPGEDKWELTQIGVTGSDGKTSGFYEVETTLYKHTIFVGGVVVINETVGRVMLPESTPYTITWNIGTAAEIPYIDADEKTQLIKSLTYNNNTLVVTYSYTDTNSTNEGGRLYVLRERYHTTDELICNTTSALSSITLTCDISTEEEGRYIARGFITRNGEEIEVDRISFNKETAKATFGKTGLLLGWFIILVAAMAFLWHPIIGLIAIDLAFIFVNLIGFINFSPLFTFGIIGVSIIIIWLFKD